MRSHEHTLPKYPLDPMGLKSVMSEDRSQLTRRLSMSILAWIVLGLISGFIASKIVNKQGEGVLLDIVLGIVVLGIVGALVGGWVFAAIGHSPVTGVNLYSIFVSVIGAILVLVVYHALSGGGRRTV